MVSPVYGSGNHAQTAIIAANSDDAVLQKGIEWTLRDIRGLISLAETTTNRERLRSLREVEKILSEIKGA